MAQGTLCMFNIRFYLINSGVKYRVEITEFVEDSKRLPSGVPLI